LEHTVKLFNRLWSSAPGNRRKVLDRLFTAVLVVISLWTAVDVIRGSEDSWQVGLACMLAFLSGWLLKAITPDRKGD
jgi:hypothetical protein